MKIETTLECPLHDSFRVRQVAGMFGLPLERTCRETFAAEVPGMDQPWRIGLIVGPSGSGKSTIAREAFGDALYRPRVWPPRQAVIDCFGEVPLKRITHTLTAVGFSSPPSWIKPLAVLSRGEQFRCELAEALLQPGALVVFDEFTSVVDRTVAQIGSAAVAKAIGRGRIEKRFVAVTCHDDVRRWLQPDWTLDMASGLLRRGRLRRPAIRLEIFRCHHSAWRLFGRHHYLSARLNRAAHGYLATWRERPVAFCAVLGAAGRRRWWRISRIVVLPDFQGVGIGTNTLDAVAGLYAQQGDRVTITSSHPAMIRALDASGRWRATSVKKGGFSAQPKLQTGSSKREKSLSHGRNVVSFRFVAKGDNQTSAWN